MSVNGEGNLETLYTFKCKTLILQADIFFCRNVLGTKNLGDILSERESIANMMQSTLDEATDPWGVKVERVEV